MHGRRAAKSAAVAAPAMSKPRASRGLAVLGPRLPSDAQRAARADGAIVAQYGLGDPQRGRPVLHRPRRPAAAARMGHHGVGGRGLYFLGRMVDLRVPRRRAGAGGVRLQSRGRRVARHRSIRGAHERRRARRCSRSGLSLGFGDAPGLGDARRRRFSIARGEIVAWSAKAARASRCSPTRIVGILDRRRARLARARILFAGVDLRPSRARVGRDRAAARSAMVFQSPRTALNPIRKVGEQIEDVLQASRARRRARSPRRDRRLGAVRIPDPERRYRGLPVRALGRHVPARDDRHGAGLRARSCWSPTSRRPGST